MRVSKSSNDAFSKSKSPKYPTYSVCNSFIANILDDSDELTLVKHELKTQIDASTKIKENLEKNIQELKSKLTESDQKVSKSLTEIKEKSEIIEGHIQTAIQTDTDYNIKIKTLETNFQKQLTDKDNYTKELELAMENLRKAKPTPTTQRVSTKRATKK